MKIHSDVSIFNAGSHRPTIGFLTSDVASFWGNPTWQGARAAAQAYDVNLLAFAGGYFNDANTYAEINSMQGNYMYRLANLPRVDGFLLYSSALGIHGRPAAEVADFFAQFQPRPILSLETPISGLPCLQVDTLQTMRDLVTHLIDKHGYQRIAYYRDYPGLPSRVRQRFHLFQEMLEARGLFDPELVFHSENHQDFLGWMQSKESAGIQAIVGNVGISAPGMGDGLEFVMETLDRLGYQVPDDIAVTAFNDDPELRVMDVPITTIRFPFYEMGYQGVEQILKLLAGENIPLVNIIQAPILIRQSCGCDSQRVKSAQASIDIVNNDNPRNRRTEIAAAILDSLPASSTQIMVESFVDAFLDDLDEKRPGAFLSMLKRISAQERRANKPLDIWQDAISTLHQQVVGSLQGSNAWLRAENIWQQGRVLLGEYQHRNDISLSLQKEKQAQLLQVIGQELSTSFDVRSIMDVFALRLPLLGIRAAYICLYEDAQPYTYTQPLPQWSRLVLAFDETGRKDVSADGLRFETRQLLPPDFLQWDKPSTWAIEPLFVKEEQIGYAIFKGDLPDGPPYYTLRSEVSNALRGALLVQQVHKRSAELARQNKILDAFMDNVPDMIYFKDLDSRITRVNRAYAIAQNVDSPETLIGKSDFDFFPEVVARSKYEAEQAILTTGEAIYNLEERHNESWVLTTKMPLRDENDVLIGTFGITHNITPLKQAQAEMARRAAQLDAAAQVARVTTSIQSLNQLLEKAVNVIRKGLNLYYIGLFLVEDNRAVLRAGTGKAGQKLLANNYFLPLDDRSMIGKAILTREACIALDVGEEVVRFDNSLLPSTHSEMALPIRHKGVILGALTIQASEINAFTPADVTTLSTIADQLGNAIANAKLVNGLEAKQAEVETMYAEVQQRAAELKIARDTADAANRAKSEFLASMSHELRTPLNGILGYAQILRRHKNLTQQQLDGLDIIYKSGDHLLTLINDILDLAKIEARRLDLVAVPFNLSEFLRSLVALVRTRADQKDLPFRFEAISGLPETILADEKRLRQVLLNLLGNAVKFTTSGAVILRVGCVTPEGKLTAYMPGLTNYHLRFEVQDTGPGLSAQALGRLFKAFEQVGDAKQRAEGTGLGLAISQSLIQAMGSVIKAHSEVEQGSTFWFDLDLPVAQMASIGDSENVDTIIGYRGPRLKILVVDDKEYNRAVLVNLLSPLGFEMFEAEDGRHGVEQAQTIRPDLIFMDVVMPEMMGDEATRIIRQNPETQNVVVIAASASAFDEDRRQALVAGCDDFIAKPINIHELFRALAKHLHLEWEYEKVNDAGMAPIPATTDVATQSVPPPADEIALLYDLAMRGDVNGIQKRAAHLQTLGEQYHPLAARLNELAKNYEIDAIEALIEKFRK